MCVCIHVHMSICKHEHENTCMTSCISASLPICICVCMTPLDHRPPARNTSPAPAARRAPAQPLVRARSGHAGLVGEHVRALPLQLVRHHHAARARGSAVCVLAGRGKVHDLLGCHMHQATARARATHKRLARNKNTVQLGRAERANFRLTGPAARRMEAS